MTLSYIRKEINFKAKESNTYSTKPFVQLNKLLLRRNHYILWK